MNERLVAIRWEAKSELSEAIVINISSLFRKSQSVLTLDVSYARFNKNITQSVFETTSS
jgi:hypothetical protein